MISTNTLLPTSARAAIATGPWPLYSMMNGRHDKPGANDGMSMINVRYWFRGSPNNELIGRKSIITCMMRLNPMASRGMRMR